MERLAEDVVAAREHRLRAAHEAWLRTRRLLSRDDYLEKYRLDGQVFDEAVRRGRLEGVRSPHLVAAPYYPNEALSEGALAELIAALDADAFLITTEAAAFLGVSARKFAALRRAGRVCPAVPDWNRDGRYDGLFYALGDLKRLKGELGEPQVDETQAQRWGRLSEKQRAYLKVLRRLERGKEAYYRSRWAMYSELKKGGAWRWINQKEFDDGLHRDGLRGRGKGAVLKSFADMGYLERRAHELKLTRSGRRLANTMGSA